MSDRLTRLTAVAVLALALLSLRPVGSDDTFMYAATGRWVVEHAEVPRTDPLSWTAAGQPWLSNGWLFGVAAWEAHQVAGLGGIAALTPLLVLAIGAAGGFAAAGLGAGRRGASFAAVSAAGGSLFFAEARPHMASYACFLLVIGTAARAGADLDRPWRWVAATFGVQLLWANLHSVAPFGVVAAAVVAAGAWWAQRSTRALLGAGAVVLAAALGTAATPFGLEPLRHASEVRAASRDVITEWFPLWRLSPADPPVLLFLAVVVLAAVVVVRTGGVRRRPELVLLLAGFAALSVDANRTVGFLVQAAAVALPALHFGAGADAGAGTGVAAGDRPLPADRLRFLEVGALGLLACGLVVAALALPSVGEPDPGVPVAATAALPAGCRILNDRHAGGWVLLRRPDVPVSNDGRNDLYGQAGYDRQITWFLPDSPGGSTATLDRWGVTCVLFLDANPASAALERAGWRRLPAKGPGFVLVRPE